MSQTSIRTSIDGPHAAITLSTDTGINVMSARLLRELHGVVAKLSADKNIRTVSIAGEGKVFAAGADIKEMSTFTPAQAREYSELGQEVLHDIAEMPAISVAALNGPALGGGLELALACDFRVSVKSAKIGLPETSLGLIPGWAGIPRLSRLIGPTKAKRLYLSALPISAEDGLMMGLVDEVVNSAEDLASRVRAFCRSFLRASPAAVALAKRAWRTADDVSAFSECFGTPEAREGIRAFLEKRQASWME